MEDPRKLKLAKAAMAAFEAAPSHETLAAVMAAVEPVREAIEQTDDWRGKPEVKFTSIDDEGNEPSPAVPGWPERNKVAIARLQNEARAEESARLEAAARAKDEADKANIVALKAAIAEEDRKRRAEEERRNAARRLRRVTLH